MSRWPREICRVTVAFARRTYASSVTLPSSVSPQSDSSRVIIYTGIRPRSDLDPTHYELDRGRRAAGKEGEALGKESEDGCTAGRVE